MAPVDDFVYEEHASVEREHWWFQGRRQVVASVLRRHLGPDQGDRRILDVGSGTGEMLDMLREFGDVHGLDMSPKAVAYCRDRFGSSVDVRVGRVPDDLSPADVVTAFDVIEHLEDDAGALGKIHALLPPGGLFICTVPAFSFLWSGHDVVNHHKRRYTRRLLLRRLRDAGFEVDRISYFNTLFFPLVAGIRLVRRRSSAAPVSDIAMPSPRINAILKRLFSSERWLVTRMDLPVGVSLLAVCRKPVL